MSKVGANGLLELRKSLTERRDALVSKLRLMEQQLQSVNTTIDLLGIGSFQLDLSDSLQNLPDLKGLTQLEALIKLAQANNNHLKMTTARMALLKTGLCMSPKNAYNIIFNVIKRSEKFKKISPGEYELIQPASSTTGSMTADAVLKRAV